LLSKEASEAAISVLASALPPHIVFLIRHSSVPSETIQVIAKEMSNAKPAVRKAFVRLAGSVFLGDQSILDTESGAAFARVLLPSFESCLKTVSSNPLNTGPLEGYVSATVLLGAFAKSKEFGSFKHLVDISLSLIVLLRCLDPSEFYSIEYRVRRHKTVIPAVG
jgi:hypothetical protein